MEKKQNKINKFYLAFIGVFLLGISFLILTPKKANADVVAQNDIYSYEYYNNDLRITQYNPNNAIDIYYQTIINIELEIEYVTSDTGELIAYIATPTLYFTIIDVSRDIQYDFAIEGQLTSDDNEIFTIINIDKYTNYNTYLTTRLEFDFKDTYTGGGIYSNLLNCNLTIYPGDTDISNQVHYFFGAQNLAFIPSQTYNNISDTSYTQKHYLDYINDYVVTHNLTLDLDFSDFLVTSVSGFLDFQIVPGLSLSAILMFIISLGLLFFMIKVFMGG